MTFPLILASNGKKFGKSEGNALFLDKKKTTPYTIYQYFMNTTDEDVSRFLKIFTLLSLEEIDSIVAKHMEAPEKRMGQALLAEKVIEIIHGQKEAETVKKISKVIFASGEEKLDILSNLSESEIDDLAAEIGSVDVKEWDNILDVLEQSGLVSSRGEGKKLIKQWGLSWNEKAITDMGMTIDASTMLSNGIAFLRKWKKSYKLVKIS